MSVKGREKSAAGLIPREFPASTTMASSSNHCQPRGRRPITIANRTIAAGAVTGYIPRMRFEKVWVQQCRATKAIKRRFGAKSALDYLVGEKLISFADAARAHPAFARELPKFLAAIRHTFNEYEIAGYVATRKPASRNRLRQLLFLR